MRHRLRPGAGCVLLLLSLPGRRFSWPAAHRRPGGRAARPWPACPGTPSASSPQALTEAQSDQNMISFTRCMRGHGVQMSDPVHRPGHAGLSIDMPSRGPANNAAYAACIHFIQANITAKQAGAAARAAPHLAALTRYAQCMRSHDINMLDPTPLGDLEPGARARHHQRLRPVLAAVPGGRRGLQALPPGRGQGRRDRPVRPGRDGVRWRSRWWPRRWPAAVAAVAVRGGQAAPAAPGAAEGGPRPRWCGRTWSPRR